MKLIISAAAAVITVAALGGTADAAPNGSRWGADYFPNVPLTTQYGKTVRFYDDLLKGKTVALYLMYTTCKYACPLETARMAQTQRLLGDRVGKDIFFYSISIDPAHDTPAVLKQYAERYHAGPGWLFLTGKPADIELISKKLGLYSPPDPSNPDGHVPELMIGNEPTAQWMKNSATDNPKLLSLMIGQYLESWKHRGAALAGSYAEAPDLNMDRGQYVFATKCAACHTIGHGDRIGPDLLGITSARDHGWLARFIVSSGDMVAKGDPMAKALFAKYNRVQMPDSALGREEVEAVMTYLDRKVLYYVDPMHPAYKSGKPGKAPDCGMPLEPVFATSSPKKAAISTR